MVIASRLAEYRPRNILLLKAIKLEPEYQPELFDDFYVEVIRQYPKLMKESSIVYPLYKDDELFGVKIKIDVRDGPIESVGTFYHEIYHTKDYAKQKGISEENTQHINMFTNELRAEWYAYKRLLRFLWNIINQKTITFISRFNQ